MGWRDILKPVMRNYLEVLNVFKGVPQRLHVLMSDAKLSEFDGMKR
jgi:hypothetical protein